VKEERRRSYFIERESEEREREMTNEKTGLMAYL